jgi:hypothetical protein
MPKVRHEPRAEGREKARNTEVNMKRLSLIIVAISAATVFAVAAVIAHEGEDHGADMKASANAKEITVKGEVLDMVCYIDHNATGAKHADCAKKCINDGLPVGIKGEDGKTYLLVGEHKPLNSELAKYAAQTITVKGKYVSRDGFNMIENVEVQK